MWVEGGFAGEHPFEWIIGNGSEPAIDHKCMNVFFVYPILATGTIYFNDDRHQVRMRH